MWRCVCELDMVHYIHVIAVSNHVVELVINNLHILPRAVLACIGIFELEPFGISWCLYFANKYAWCVVKCA